MLATLHPLFERGTWLKSHETACEYPSQQKGIAAGSRWWLQQFGQFHPEARDVKCFSSYVSVQGCKIGPVCVPVCVCRSVSQYSPGWTVWHTSPKWCIFYFDFLTNLSHFPDIFFKPGQEGAATLRHFHIIPLQLANGSAFLRNLHILGLRKCNMQDVKRRYKVTLLVWEIQGYCDRLMANGHWWVFIFTH